MRNALLITILALAPVAAAAHQSDETSCETRLGVTEPRRNPPFEIRVSERVPEEAEKYRKYIAHITKPDGLLEKLGIRMTGQIIEFLPGRDLNAVTSGTSGGYPVPFFIDGAQIMRSLTQTRGGYALEVVYPGPHWQHGFYRDDNQTERQISIIDHVVGHNMFAFSSGLDHYRAGQGMVASQRLGALLERLYHEFDKDEVQRFYLWALSMTNMLDMSTPVYAKSEEFEPRVNFADFDPLGRNRGKLARHPKHVTENILAAFAANISPTQPAWKREILDLLALTIAFRPALVHTQVMNEGFASIMQEILAVNSDINHEPYYITEAVRVMQGEDKPELMNPYSLGVFCWRHLRDRFHKRPEMVGRPTIEIDRAFLKYAVDEVIGHMVDDEFLRYALDQELIDRTRLAIVRKATPDEIDPNLPRPPTEQPIEQYTIVSRNAQRVVQSINEMVLKPKYVYNPRVRLKDFTRPATGEVEFLIDDDNGSRWPLRKQTVGPALFAMANIIEAPISLEARLLAKPKPVAMPPPPPTQFGPWGGWIPRPAPPRRPEPELVHARIVVSPKGDVRVYRITSESDAPRSLYPGDFDRGALPEALDDELTTEVTKNLRAYLDDLYLDQPEAEEDLLRHSPGLRKVIAAQMTRQMNDVEFEGVVSHAPGAAGALLEYRRVVDRRVQAALARAAKAGRGIAMPGGQVRVKALPSVVHIEFDTAYVQKLEGQRPPEPVGKINRTFQWKDEDLDKPLYGAAFGRVDGAPAAVAPIDGKPGDKVWGPGTPPGGGPGDPDDGDPDDGDEMVRGPKPGHDPDDPSWVDLPDDLLAAFLGEQVKLPHLNRKPGEARHLRSRKGKKRRQMHGDMMIFEITQNAYQRGQAKAYEEGRDPEDDIQDTLEQGMELLQPRDWIVRSRKPAIHKETKAVVTFIRDGSGSTAKYIEAFKRFVHDTKLLIGARYAGFEFRFITFDARAHMHKNLDEFLRFQVGGGTYYDEGLKMALKDFRDNYPRSIWDRYTFLLGDLEDGDDPAMKRIKEIVEETEYFGTVAGLNFGEPTWGLFPPLRAETASSDKMGMTILNQDGTYTIDHLREVMSNTEEDVH